MFKKIKGEVEKVSQLVLFNREVVNTVFALPRGNPATRFVSLFYTFDLRPWKNIEYSCCSTGPILLWAIFHVMRFADTSLCHQNQSNNVFTCAYFFPQPRILSSMYCVVHVHRILHACTTTMISGTIFKIFK